MKKPRERIKKGAKQKINEKERRNGWKRRNREIRR
jgi:hypothetical protein